MTEGWRAVLTVILRTGLGRRQRQRSLRISSGTAETPGGEGEQDAMEVDNIHAMVEGVKNRGVSTERTLLLRQIY